MADGTGARGLGRRGGFAPGDAVLLLAAAAVVAALLWPRWERRAFQERVEEATRAVDATRDALVGVHRAGGAWPPESAPGRVPPELDRATVGGDGAFRAGGATLQVRRWTLPAPPGTGTGDADDAIGPGAPPGAGSAEDGEADLPAGEAEPAGTADQEPDEAVASPPRAVQLAGITVHAGEPALLAALLRAYGRERSFVRDTTWTLVVAPEPAAGGSDDGPS